MAISNEALLIHQDSLGELCRDILSIPPLGLFIYFIRNIWVINAVITSCLRQILAFY